MADDLPELHSYANGLKRRPERTHLPHNSGAVRTGAPFCECGIGCCATLKSHHGRGIHDAQEALDEPDRRIGEVSSVIVKVPGRRPTDLADRQSRPQLPHLQ